MTDETIRRGPGRPPKNPVPRDEAPAVEMRGEDDPCLVVRLNRAVWIGEQRNDPPSEMVVSIAQFREWAKTDLATLIGVVK